MGRGRGPSDLGHNAEGSRQGCRRSQGGGAAGANGLEADVDAG